MSGFLDDDDLTARALAAAVQAGRISAEAATRGFLDRIEARDGGVQAWVHLDPEGALAAARAVDRGEVKGPLAGVPLAVKDVIDTGDMPTEYGSAIYRGFRPGRDAGCVHLARRAGAVALGKTVTTEFATMSPGPTANPFAAAHTPGGSSSGTAAALGAGMTLLGFGTQTSGSTIRPAAFCGVVGYKASLGRIDRTGIKPLAESLDVLGVMARDVRDAAALAAVVARDPALNGGAAAEIPADISAEIPAGLFLPEQSGPELSADGRAALLAAADVLGGLAAVATPDWWDALGPAHEAVFAWEASAALAPERDLHWDIVTEASRGFLARQAQSTLAGWKAGIAAREAALVDLDALFGPHEVLITPPASGAAPEGLGSTGNAAFNLRWTLLGTPSLSLPAGIDAHGLPLGIQIVARPGQDARLLAVAAAVEDRLRAAGLAARPAGFGAGL